MTANTRQPFDPSTASEATPASAPWLIPDPNASLTRPQAAAFLGISAPFLKKLDLEGRGPAAYRIGRRWTYQKADLLAWRETFRVESRIASLPLAETVKVDPATLPPPCPDDPPPPRRRGRRPASEVQREVA